MPSKMTYALFMKFIEAGIQLPLGLRTEIEGNYYCTKCGAGWPIEMSFCWDCHTKSKRPPIYEVKLEDTKLVGLY